MKRLALLTLTAGLLALNAGVAQDRTTAPAPHDHSAAPVPDARPTAPAQRSEYAVRHADPAALVEAVAGHFRGEAKLTATGRAEGRDNRNPFGGVATRSVSYQPVGTTVRATARIGASDAIAIDLNVQDTRIRPSEEEGGAAAFDNGTLTVAVNVASGKSVVTQAVRTDGKYCLIVPNCDGYDPRLPLKTPNIFAIGVAPMLDWLFAPSCPCDSAAKAWIEERLEWLAGEFEDSAFTGRRIVLPTPEFFPDPYDGSKKAVRRLLHRVCEYMDVVPDLVRLRFVADAGKLQLENEAGHALPDAAGTYQEGERTFIVSIDKAGLHDATGLVGTIAHELAHVRLLGESRIMREVFDNELLTDLTVVHFGLGIFLANVPRNWDSQYSKWPDSDLLKPEYMTPPMFGWAPAHLAWFRGEERPAWAQYLNGGARANLKQGVRYLNATRDSWYRPPRLRGERGKG